MKGKREVRVSVVRNPCVWVFVAHEGGSGGRAVVEETDGDYPG